MTKVLILHPGAMGVSIGLNLNINDHETYWVSENRSTATAKRANDQGMNEVSNLQQALEIAEVVISICPPSVAFDVAVSVAKHEFNGIYCDANAVAPDTSLRIAEIFNDSYVDGAVVGPPSHSPGTTRLYLAGVNAHVIAELFAGSHLGCCIMPKGVVSASALKMCYAAYTKGTAALILALRAKAEHYGISDALQQEWEQSIPGLWERSERMSQGVSRKAWRFAPEMREIARSFEMASLPNGFHKAAAEIYERMTSLRDVSEVSTEAIVTQLLKS
ncbi:MAG: DUF1932 domain-containing protein [Gammaproteobacteria bacterium]|nr:DUF1932 domain-containing protein [Gammaproteobacteria bacterium]MDE0252292.1 DUF1932 domain-containing protein [Gammaproteobacteria bacterium]MDE0402599.1 DUF1932 domain-containing protein [Gammaproteobacteria bacterium]MDE0646080.1 DUF1932 domain-containing protein [Gammaproteobacteria bacterium]